MKEKFFNNEYKFLFCSITFNLKTNIKKIFSENFKL